MKLRFITLPLVATALLVGCATEGARPPVNTTKSNLETTEKFVLMDKGTQRSVTSDGLQERTLSVGRLEVAANVRNRENRRIQVQMNCAFKDNQGFVVDETPWQNVMLTENEQQTVRFVSANGQAKWYTIRVRQTR